MQKHFKLLFIAAMVLPLYAATGQPITTLSQHRTHFQDFKLASFYFGGEQTRFVWLNMPAFFNHASISAHQSLPLGQKDDLEFAQTRILVKGEEQSLDAYIKSDTRIDSVVVVHQGNIIFQHYNSHQAWDRHIVWSVTKVIVSAALAELANQQQVDLSAPVKMYLPTFSASDWGQKSVQEVADMQSKMDCNDSQGFDNPQNCVYRVDEIFNIMPQKSASLSSAKEYLKTIKENPSATPYTEYNSANTLILGFIVEAVTQKPLHEALAELIWRPMGAEADGLMMINRFGELYAGGGISARLNDIARFGMLFTASAHTPLIRNKKAYGLGDMHQPDSFSVARKQSLNKLFNGDPPQHSKMQWDLIWSDGDMYKDGFSGQGIYVSPANDFVMAWFGTADTNFNKHHLLPIARQLSSQFAYRGLD